MPEQRGARDWSLFLHDMQSFCDKVIRYTAGLSATQFADNELVYDAVLRNLELLGEAAKQIPNSVRLSYPDVPWRRIAGLRDVLAHAYFGLEEETIWQVVSTSIPNLRMQLDAMAAQEGLSAQGAMPQPPSVVQIDDNLQS